MELFGELAASVATVGETRRIGAWIFLRGLGVVYLVAFVSLWLQLPGLLGEGGILPARDLLRQVRGRNRRLPVARYPTLFWLGAGDPWLHGACAVGVLLSLLLASGVAPAPILLLLWAFYLSFAVVGQVFLSYQWDLLLLEAGFLGVFLAPWTHPAAGGGRPAGFAVLLLWWLLFRLVFQSGVGKLTSGDATWRDLTALTHHYETQPLPAWTAWWAHQLPEAVHRFSTAAALVLEIAFPLLIFGTEEARLAACAGIVLLQALIMATGNYNFFNLLTVLLACLLVGDATWSALLPEGLLEGLVPPGARAGGGASVAGSTPEGPSALQTGLTWAVAGLVGVVSLGRLWRTALPGRGLPAWLRRLLRKVDPFRTINSYGLFRVMTTRRPEVVIEGSRDGESWKAYGFRWKPGDTSRRPRFCMPHQPRLDWQMWFAALRGFRDVGWLRAFLGRLLEGRPEVRRLLERDPFTDGPPRYVRATLYEYRFTSREERRAEGDWWARERLGPYAPVLARREGAGG